MIWETSPIDNYYICFHIRCYIKFTLNMLMNRHQTVSITKTKPNMLKKQTNLMPHNKNTIKKM